ncbi:MAG TPA: ATP-binding protein [Steroidobacteraceae bacterium]|nr:ATP-binding protein [Steroidobacteraceae bacterium]
MSEQPTADVLRLRVLAEQIRLMSQYMTSPLFGSIFLGAMLAWLTSEEHGGGAAWGWYGLLMLVTLARWRVARAYLSREHSDNQVLRFRALMFALAAIAGSVWSLSGTLLLPSDPLREVIVAIFFIGATASGMGSQAPVPYAYAALLIPFMLPFAIKQFLMGSDRVVLGLGLLLYILVMLIIARRQTISFERQIRLAFENTSLVDALRRERDRTARINEELQSQIEEQRTATRQIAALNRKLQARTIELQAANKDLEGFSYSVSHDLRGPLRAIDGFSSLLRGHLRQADDAQSQHYFTRIRENISRMSTLIDDLLEFARCGREKLHREDLNMNALVSDAVQQVRSAHSDIDVEIIVEPLPHAQGDLVLIRQVWLNLLDNALKYSSRVAGPRVIVTGREEPEMTIFEIADNGVGFDNKYSEGMFVAFKRLHGAEYAGTGVGLAIVHRIVTRHGGQVWARSSVGNGATFGFSLPHLPLTATDPQLNAADVNAVQ